MATINDFGIPGVGAGILHPKLTNRFVVVFRGSPRHSQKLTTDEELAAGLQALSMQVTAIKLPTIAFQGLHGFAPNNAGMFRVGTVGRVEFQVQDDVNSVVLKTLLALRAVDDLSIIVMKTDGNDYVIDAYELRGVTLQTLEHSVLRYDGGTSRVSGSILHQQPDERGNVPRSEVSLSVGADKFGAGVPEFRVSGDVQSMMMTVSSGRTIQELLEIL